MQRSNVVQPWHTQHWGPHLQRGAPSDEAKRVLPLPGMAHDDALLECLGRLTVGVQRRADLRDGDRAKTAVGDTSLMRTLLAASKRGRVPVWNC